MKTHRSIFLVSFLGLSLILSFDSFGFGPVGHETVAYIAQDRLSPATLSKALAVLDRDDDLADVANWADAIRNFQEETKPWHFIDLPIRQNVQRSDVPNFCANNDCVIAQIQINKGILSDTAQPRREKQKAMKFLVHFMGDLHQPLHAADDDDKGGNDKIIRFQKKKMKLHALWDGLIEKQVTEKSRDLATSLGSGITTAKAKAWMAGDETTWALEGYKIAKDKIYKNYSEGAQDLTNVNLGNAYFNQMRPIVEEQLQKAGVRLAKVLQEIFGD